MTTAENWAATDPGVLAKEIGMVPAAEAAIGLRTLSTVISGGNPCHRCGNKATTQWQQQASAEEAEAHWAAVEQNIRACGTPDYTADRTEPVVKAVHGCDEHVVDAPHLTHDADCGGHGACDCTTDPS